MAMTKTFDVIVVGAALNGLTAGLALGGHRARRPLSVAIIDHPDNPGYPTYWHARGYGLFAANTLGQEALSDGKEKLNFTLEAGKAITFRYRIVITNGTVPTASELDKEAGEFSKTR